jgi:hypothetical protein
MYTHPPIDTVQQYSQPTDTSPLAPTAQRQKHLQSGFHFTCTCPRCTSAGKTDATLQQISSIQAELNDWSSSAHQPASHYTSLAEHLLDLHRSEGLEGFMDVAFGFAALAYSSVGDAERALMFAKKAKEAVLMKDGQWAPNLGIWEEVLAAPKAHWSWKRRV